jgi:hypothetical protein
MLLTILACVVGYLAVGVLVAFVCGVTGWCDEMDEYSVCILCWPAIAIAGSFFMIAYGTERVASAAREALAARKPPTEEEL